MDGRQHSLHQETGCTARNACGPPAHLCLAGLAGDALHKQAAISRRLGHQRIRISQLNGQLSGVPVVLPAVQLAEGAARLEEQLHGAAPAQRVCFLAGRGLAPQLCRRPGRGR